MSWRGGRGRGRGGGFGSFGGGFVKPVPFELFPVVELPDVKAVVEDKTLVIWDAKLQNYWKASPYYLESNASKNESQGIDIERYSDWGKAKNASRRISLNQILQLHSLNFPKELIGVSKSAQRSAKKMRWDLDKGLARLDKLEKLEKNFEENEGKEKKSDGDEENSDAEIEEEAEYSDDGDYNENECFDDDEDDYNMEDAGGGDDEATY